MDMRVDSAVVTLVEAMMPRWSGNLGLEVVLDLCWTVYSETDEDEDKRIRKDVRFLFMRECNYTKVFVRVTDVGITHRPKTVDQWKLVSDHDSCWPSGIEGVLNNLEDEARKVFTGTEPPSRNMTFSIFTPPNFKEVVSYKLEDGQDRFGGTYMVRLGKSLSRLEAAQMMKEKKA